jgi:hypothetical protein
MRYERGGQRVPEIGDGLAFKKLVLTDQHALDDPNGDPSGLAGLAEERWMHGECTGVHPDGTVSIKTPDGTVTVLSAEHCYVSDL